MSFFKRVGPFEKAPFGYGVAWYDWPTNTTVWSPVPLNWAVRLGLLVYWWLARPARCLYERTRSAEAERDDAERRLRDVTTARDTFNRLWSKALVAVKDRDDEIRALRAEIQRLQLNSVSDDWDYDTRDLDLDN